MCVCVCVYIYIYMYMCAYITYILFIYIYIYIYIYILFPFSVVRNLIVQNMTFTLNVLWQWQTYTPLGSMLNSTFRQGSEVDGLGLITVINTMINILKGISTIDCIIKIRIFPWVCKPNFLIYFSYYLYPSHTTSVNVLSLKY